MARTLSFDLDCLSADLSSDDPAIVSAAVRGLSPRLGTLDDAAYERAVETLCSLFYVDTADRPDLEAALDEATTLLTGQGARVVPHLLRQMRSSDIKSHLYLARTLGRIGTGALPALRDLLATSEDRYARAFALYALGKMSCPEVARALPEVLGGLMHPDKEVRDSASRTIGRIAAAVPKHGLSPGRRREMFEALMRAIHDLEVPVRAKAMRSLGKMAAAGLLTRHQEKAVTAAARAALGESPGFVWDHAYIVRREAGEALQIVSRGRPVAARASRPSVRQQPPPAR
jgi:HEAT repeat protein